jgi:glycosyltransferase involved in cell wall biosynthesis
MKSNKYSRILAVTTVLNNVEYVEDCVLSVLNQNYPNLEAIVIDGGSTYGTVEIIEKYVDTLAYFVSEKDSGQTQALNRGFAKVTGDVLGFRLSKLEAGLGLP